MPPPTGDCEPLAERYRQLMALAQGFIVKSRPMREVLLGSGPPQIASSSARPAPMERCLLMLPRRMRHPRCCLSDGWWKRRALWMP